MAEPPAPVEDAAGEADRPGRLGLLSRLAVDVTPLRESAMLAVAGAADFVSAVLRSTILLTATPDTMRGRVSGIELAQVASAPALGNLEAGAVASLTSLRFSIVSGGVACVAGTLVTALAFPALLRYNAKRAREA